MRSVTIKEAKAHLNELIDAATNGEQIVLMRGSKHVATLVPIQDSDLELLSEITDRRAAAIWSEVHAPTVRVFDSAESAVRDLKRPRRKKRAA